MIATTGRYARRATLFAALFLTSGALLPLAAWSAPFQGGIVTIIVPGPAGSSFDNAARAVAEPLAKIWGVPVVVDNRAGAGGAIAATAVIKAAPDGRTILFAGTPFVQVPYLRSNAGYDPITNFAPLARMFDARLWLAVNTSVPAKTVQEFVALAKAPGANYSYSSPGAGSTPHLNSALLTRKANVQMLHVPYKGVSPAVVDLASGQVTATFASYSDLIPHVQNGKVRILASTGEARSPLSRDVPTMKEAGFGGFETVGFGGLVVPVATPKAVVDDMARDLSKVLAMPEVRARFITLGFEPANEGPRAFGTLLKEQAVYWKKIIDDASIKAE